jgi:hypothetical protein
MRMELWQAHCGPHGGANVALPSTALWRCAWCNALTGLAYGTQLYIHAAFT